jgi:hypothetical protein
MPARAPHASNTNDGQFRCEAGLAIFNDKTTGCLAK